MQYRPAELLTGKKLRDGWTVQNIIHRKPDETGGQFSISYKVKNDSGQEGFLKALDFSGALISEDPARELEKLTSAYNFERDSLNKCKKMSRVVTALTFGSIEVEEFTKAKVVQYIIFELADSSIRERIVNNSRPELSWCIRGLHQITVGLWQLHSSRIAHQDIKPSNMLLFEGSGIKVGDLGRVVDKNRSASHDELEWPGDWIYAPPEIAFGYIHHDFNVRRFSSDLYLLGSLAVSILTCLQMNYWLAKEIPVEHKPNSWGGNFVGEYKEALPYVQLAFASVIEKIKTQIVTEDRIVEELIVCIKELCNPIPENRGDKKTHAAQGRGGNKFDLERYVSRFDRLSLAAKVYERKQSSK